MTLSDVLGVLGFVLALGLAIKALLRDRPIVVVYPAAQFINTGTALAHLRVMLTVCNLGAVAVPVTSLAVGQFPLPGTYRDSVPSGLVPPDSLANPTLPCVIEPGHALTWSVSADWLATQFGNDLPPTVAGEVTYLTPHRFQPWRSGAARRRSLSKPISIANVPFGSESESA